MQRFRYPKLRESMVGSWCPSLGVSGPTLLDRSGRGNHGTLTNMDPATDWVASSGAGRGGWALDFDGSNDYVRIPHSSSLNFVEEYSLSGWINPNSPSVSYAALVSKPTNFVGNPYNMYGLQAWAAVGTPPRMVLGNAGAEYTLSATTTLPSGQWSHVGCSFRRGLCEIYVNGRLENSTTFGFSAIEQNTQPLGIGGVDRAGVADTARAWIDSVSVFNVALQQSQFRLLGNFRGIEHENYTVPVFRGVTLSGGTIAGALNATIDDVTSIGSGALSVAGSLNATIGDVTSSGSGRVSIAGQIAASIGDVVCSGNGAVSIAGSVNATIGDIVASGSGDLADGPTGSLAGTIGDVTSSGSGRVSIAGQVAATIGDVVSSGNGAVSIQSTAGIAVGDVVAASTAKLNIRSTAGITLGDVMAAGVGGVPITGSLIPQFHELIMGASYGN